MLKSGSVYPREISERNYQLRNICRFFSERARTNFSQIGPVPGFGKGLLRNVQIDLLRAIKTMQDGK